MKTLAKLLAPLTLHQRSGLKVEDAKKWPEIEIPDNFLIQLEEYSVESGELQSTSTQFVYKFDSDGDKEHLQKFIGKDVTTDPVHEHLYDHKTGNAVEVENKN